MTKQSIEEIYKGKPQVQSCQLSGTIYPQKAQALGPCTPSDAIAPHKKIAVHSASELHFHPNLCT